MIVKCMGEEKFCLKALSLSHHFSRSVGNSCRIVAFTVIDVCLAQISLLQTLPNKKAETHLCVLFSTVQNPTREPNAKLSICTLIFHIFRNDFGFSRALFGHRHIIYVRKIYCTVESREENFNKS